MHFEVVEVRTRDAYRGAQEPLRFVWRKRPYEIAQVLDRWIEGRMDSTRMPLRYFRVSTPGGENFILRFHEYFRTWSILVPAVYGSRSEGDSQETPGEAT